jgi:RecJ-like exonuclease
MKIQELLEGNSTRIRLSSAWSETTTYDGTLIWSTTQKEAVKCTTCKGKGEIPIFLKITKKCEECNGEGYISKYNTTFVEFTESEHEFIKETFVSKFEKSYMNNNSTNTTNIIPRNLIQKIFQETVKFIHNDQTHLDRPESSNTIRRLNPVPDTNIINLKVNKKIIEPVDSNDLIEITKKFSNFLYDVQRLPGASIIAQIRY